MVKSKEFRFVLLSVFLTVSAFIIVIIVSHLENPDTVSLNLLFRPFPGIIIVNVWSLEN